MNDPRLILARRDLADAALQGLVKAGRFDKTDAYHCAVPVAAIRRAPDAAAEQLDQLLYGETFRVIETGDGWGWGQADRDGYVGHVLLGDLEPGVLPATHRVGALRAYAFSHPDIKSSPLALLSLNALIAVEAEEGRFLKAAGSGWIPAVQLLPPSARARPIPAAVAERFLGAPYQWGGRESLGLDCSGLVQQALYACGRAGPRDSDQQQALGWQPSPCGGRAGARRPRLLARPRGHDAGRRPADPRQRLPHASPDRAAGRSGRPDRGAPRVQAAMTGA